MNYHWYLFRANDMAARVTITDWESQDEPGGPLGQQLMFNYAQVHPYYPGKNRRCRLSEKDVL